MDIFETYRKRLKRIGIFKSIMIAFSFAFAFVGIAASINWLVKASLLVTLATTLGAGVTVFLIALFLLYYKRFRPTNEMIAKKLDALGQEERYITMFECQEDMSTMAKLQREDAKKKISSISSKSLKFSLALPIVLIFVLGFIFATATTTGSVLSSVGKIGVPGSESELSPIEPVEKFIVTYKVYEEGTGRIEGKTTQQVEKGHYTQAVTAIPAENYRFVAWVDKDKNYLSNQKNPRSEVNVHEDMTIYALFGEKEPNKDDDTDGDKDIDGDDNENPDKGGDGGDSEDQGGDQGQQGGGISGGESGEGHENNNVIDGTQNYKDNFDREGLEDELSNSDLPDELKDILGDYYGSLKP